MLSKGERNRQHIVAVANRLFYERGYNQTSFTDIADAAEIPRGNFYYYFKTKDDILAAVVDHRLLKIRPMLEEWDRGFPTPMARLRRFVDILRNSEEEVARYGCPMGSLNIELGKAQPALKAKAREMFDVFRGWLARQFRELGFGDQADALALHLLGRAQGISVIAQVYGDRELLNTEADALEAWLDTLRPPA
jgi:AcrR family transcriptional regulator